ncbi:MAG: NfeD family protein [Bdellovibrionales bacterium]|nr:NfeD family protein [Bdellovibrionales bacterium]
MGVIVWYLIKERKKQPADAHFFLPIGSNGVVLTKQDTDSSFYQIKVKGEIWRGHSPSQLSVGDKVIVTAVNSEKLIAEIKKVDKE